MSVQLAMFSLNYEGLGTLIEVLRYAFSHPGWSVSVVLWWGFIFLLSATIIRLVIYALSCGTGDEYGQMRNKSALLKVFIITALLYLTYVFLFQSFFPPDHSPILNVFSHLAPQV